MHLLLPIPFSIMACYTDFKMGKIKNYITYPLILTGICVNTFLNGFQGFKESILGILIAVIITSVIPAFRLGGGDLKLAMGYGAFLTMKNYVMFFFFFIFFVLLGNIFLMIKQEGFGSFISELKLEIKSLGVHKTSFKKVTGAPFLLGAYLLTVVFLNSFVNVIKQL